MEKQERILDVRNLELSFHTYDGEVNAVRNVSWHLNERETIAIVGESGCGKTTLIQTVMGLNNRRNCNIKNGEILFMGDEILDKTQKEMSMLQGKQMSIIFQDPFTYLNPTMKVGKQIAEGYIKHNNVSTREAMDRVIEIMKLISLPDPEENMKKYPHQLSGGMRQRIVIAMALICNPKILFADEPTTALDVTIQAQIIELMKDLKNKIDASIVLITHDLGVVANMAERIYVMYAGEIVEHGYAEDIFENPKHPYTMGLLKAVPRLDQKNEDDLYSIPGTPPQLLKPIEGCAFAARCPYAMNVCRKYRPEFCNFDEKEHYAACFLHYPEYLAAKKETEEEV
ncbi:MAG: ABC transporter ATP-binding protein [Anaerovoracaceae bacterium]